MKTLLDEGAPDQLRQRLSALHPESKCLWGKMSVGGMLCHLNDAYTGLLRRGGAPGPTAPWAGRFLLRPMALHLPLRWPHGAPTPPEVDQLLGGTPPTLFQADRDAVIASLTAFAQAKDFAGRHHPIFGPLTEWEWMRWGWLHADHHLRQFSA